MENKIKNYLENALLIEFGSSVQPDTNLFKEGIIDSFGYIELVSFLEGEFGIKITDDELMSEALNSYENILKFIKLKTKT